MKRTATCLIVLSLLLTAGCQTTPVSTTPVVSYEAILFGTSDSEDRVQLDSEYELIDYSVYSEVPPSEEYTIDFKGKTYQGEYYRTMDIHQLPYPIYGYRNNTPGEFVTFSIDPFGNLVSLYLDYGEEPETTVVLSEDECIAAAIDYMADIKDISDFRVDFCTLYDDNDRNICFRRYIGNIPTQETVAFDIAQDGRIKSFVSTMLGNLSVDLQADGLSLEAAYAARNTHLKQLYANQIENGAEITCEDDYLYLTVLTNGQRAFVGRVTVVCKIPKGENDYRLTHRIIDVVILVE